MAHVAHVACQLRALLATGIRVAGAAAITTLMTMAQAEPDYAADRARMAAEIEAMYAETRAETGLASMSPAVRAAMGKVERHRLIPASQAPPRPRPARRKAQNIGRLVVA